MENLRNFTPSPSHKVLVTGGAGHVGSGLIRKLVELGYRDVTSIDNYSNGRECNHVDGCNYISADTREVFDIFPKNDFDVIFHFGEFARVEQSFSCLDEVFQSNYLGTLAMIKFAMAGRCKFIYSCSSAINSMNDPDLIHSPYVISKKSNRDLINTYFKLGKLRGAVVYFSNVYGGNELGTGANATVVAKFIRAKLNKERVEISSPGTQTRKFTDIGDLIRGVLLVYQFGEGDNYFIASKRSVSIVELAEMIGVEYRIVPSGPGNRTESSIDHKRMEALGWTTQTDIEDYIKNLGLVDLAMEQ
ncbi:NAD-dependent epimerase/dehydratase family protein [Shimia sp. MMG029]|uniref:NAD-dependent epimerase/dehydratase family protein n=1 Tax=Shimia sp. MMG029 TaxID=3021978 RepID=UPI0022FDE065|nr:NAD-dependent epimerase/dehydratase family protein [Shimia sp. MMG029]MDA5556954.1 NAD-dependent epimerase/dehydratase family protein [Shimia sp. MMG029]